MLHHFTQSIDPSALPSQFNCPFCYTPHPLCLQASDAVRAYLSEQSAWQEELSQGKMFGVLVVETPQHEIGFLAAYSGILQGRNDLEYFVPPIYDLLQPTGFFKTGEAEISAINRTISALENAEEYRLLKQQIEDHKAYTDDTLSRLRQEITSAKQRRNQLRQKRTLTPEEAEELVRESQFQKAEFKRTERHLKEEADALADRFYQLDNAIEQLKEERKTRSKDLQRQIFEQFTILNACGEGRDLCTIFFEAVNKLPPAGAGECCAPKLLQYAYKNGLRPLAMAEFWWGASPKTEIRHHGHFYPSCKSKCEPILGYMLQGLDVAPNPLHQATPKELKTLYEDDSIVVVVKPEGMLSVPGKESRQSVESILRERYPEVTCPMIVHRLDLSTSGILVVAKTMEAYLDLQTQFKERSVNKRYVALLEDVITQTSGEINLPLCLDPNDRPRQIVNEEFGKPAQTRFEVIATQNHHTRIALYPITGRTHQLRVHMAHPQGLNCPILGDTLYGETAERLYLHAEWIEFRHPTTHAIVTFECKADF